MSQLNECLPFVEFPLKPNSKEPKVAGWNTRAPDDLMQEFVEGDNIGLRIEPPLFVVDMDDRRLAALIEEDFPKTLKVVTRRGFHYYFVASNIYPQTSKQSGLIQLLSKGCYVVRPPSKVNGHEYSYLDPNTPIAALDGKAIEKLERMLRALGKYENLIRGFAAFWTEGHRHNLSLWLNGALRKAGLERFEAAIVIKSICLLADDDELRDRLEALKTTYEKDIEEIAGWSRLETELQAIVGVDRARELLSLLPKPKKNEGHAEGPDKPRSRYIVGGEVLDDSSLVEVVEGPRLLVYKDGKFEVHDEVEVDGVVYRPPPHIPFPLPGAPAGIGDDVSLWAETKSFIKAHFFHLDDDVYDVLTAAVAWSYFYRDVKASTPYILFLGPWRSGKSRGLEVMEALAYRAIRVVDPSEASLFRCIENFKPTLFIDESQIIDPAVRAVLASGYRFGGKVMRVVDPEAEGFDGIKFFNTYAFVVYASREEPPADIFSRSLTIHCEKNLAPVRKTIDSDRAVELRTRWLAQRLRFNGSIKVGFDEFESDDSRLQEIVSPLKAMAMFFGGPEAAAAVERHGRKVEGEIKAMESVGPEAEVLSVVVEILGEGPLSTDSPIVSVADITRKLNDGGSSVWKPEGVGKILSRLGFEKVRLGGRGLRGYKFDLDRLKRYALRYNIPTDRWQVHFDRTCQTCQTPEISAI
jgi:hypothetical protein